MSKATEFSNYLRENYPINKFSILNRRSNYGEINDACYQVAPTINDKRVCCPAYRAWRDMFNRAYNKNFHTKYPTYRNIKICEEWFSFMNFRVWWLENHEDNWQLDKDLLFIENKIYSPDTCIYIPQWLNLFTARNRVTRGQYPIGVYFEKSSGRFKAQCNNPITKKNENLGRYETKEDAYQAWLNKKTEFALVLKSEMDEIDTRIYSNVVKIINLPE